jgi:integrase
LPDRQLTVASFLTRWLDETLPEGDLKPSTLTTYRRVVRLYIAPNVGHHRLLELTAAHVSAMLRAMREMGLSASTRSQARRVLGVALAQAEREELVHRNVAHQVPGPRREPVRENRSLSRDDAQALLAAVSDDPIAVPVTLQLALGLRRGEALGVAWADIDLDHAALNLRRQLQRRERRGLHAVGEATELALEPLKTARSARQVPLPAPVVDLLRSHRARQAAARLAAGELWSTHWPDLVSTTAFGTPLDPDNYGSRLTRLAAVAGLGQVRTHTLRHTAGSLLFDSGQPMQVVSEQLGHASTRITEEVYVHLTARVREATAAAMTEVLWGTAT